MYRSLKSVWNSGNKSFKCTMWQSFLFILQLSRTYKMVHYGESLSVNAVELLYASSLLKNCKRIHFIYSTVSQVWKFTRCLTLTKVEYQSYRKGDHEKHFQSHLKMTTGNECTLLIKYELIYVWCWRTCIMWKMFVKTLSLLLLHGFVLVCISCTNYQLHDDIFIQVYCIFGYI